MYNQNNFNRALISSDQLRRLGVQLPEEYMSELASHITETINRRITEEIIESLDERQADDLLKMQDSNISDDQVENWIKENIPDYSEIIEDNVAITLGDVIKNVDKL